MCNKRRCLDRAGKRERWTGKQEGGSKEGKELAHTQSETFGSHSQAV